MTVRDRPLQVRCFPQDDDAFTYDVQRVIAECRATITAGERLLRYVQEQLRERYPSAAVRRRDELAEVYERDSEVWYAFRDGRVA